MKKARISVALASFRKNSGRIDKSSQKPSNNIGNIVSQRPEFNHRSVPFFLCGNETQNLYNYLIININALKYGTVFSKMEQKWNAPAQKWNGTKNRDNLFIFK